MDTKQRQLVTKYVDLVYRYKALLISVLLISLPLGLAIYLLTPKVYQASSLLSYQVQQISTSRLTPEVATKIRDTISTLTQIVTSRTNLEDLIVSQNLYRDARERLPMEDVVVAMRRQIRIEPSKQGDIFKIVFNYSDPDKVVTVTNALAAKFIEENLKYREERATETSEYTSDELRMAKEMMDRKEAVMRDYKVQYYNEMPEQRMTNVSRLISLQNQLQAKQESIQDLERTLVLIQDQINNRKTLLDVDGEIDLTQRPSPGEVAQKMPITPAQQLIGLRRLLEQMLTRYTEKHPDVQRTKAMIAKLEEEVKRSSEYKQAMEGRDDGQIDSLDNSDLLATDKAILQLETQRKSVVLNIKSIKEEMVELKKTIAQYEAWVAAAPTREAEWSALTREYGQLKRHYEYLVAQDLEAKSMLNLERRQKGSHFKIEDPGRYPEKPIKPDFLSIMGACLLIGTVAGLGITLAMDFFDTSFRDPETIEPLLGVPLLASIPNIPIHSEQRQAKRKMLIKGAFFVVACGAISVLFFIVWQRGYIVI